ncbi:MAG TPA: ABC transporter substrate-binding protein [Candidatus Copromorpha excrementigallinarum]|uniref:ABC transporter substrate-binding protein n=1 Tax=Candidatus Allocopromorpha excrementigallinarum TaxID=2840742 RepID=A0A9D1HZG2_9FIRM|nr:ABC transporter substrate-binding protein [Candidatus Copromorpha excrementigallinarum]
MKRYGRGAAVFMVIVLATVLLSGCATFENFKEAFIDKPQEDTTTVTIGVYEPMTGADSDGGKLETEGIELANEVYPNVDGKMVELVYADNSSDIYAAETAIRELISKEPDVILGSYGSVYSLIAGDYINEAKIPTIAITNTNPLVTANNEYYFRVCYVDSDQGDLLARYVLEHKGETTAGIMIPEGNDAAMELATAFSDRMKAETGNEDAIPLYEQYEAGAEDFTSQLEAVRASGVRSVLLTGSVNDCANIVREADEMGLGVQFLGDTSWSEKKFKRLAGSSATAENAAFVNFFVSDNASNEEARVFLEAYHEKHGENSTPEDSVALGYDAYVVAVRAIEEAGEGASGKEIRDAMEEQGQFQGASGLITFNNTGDPIKTAFIGSWDGNQVVSVYTLDPT